MGTIHTWPSSTLFPKTWFCGVGQFVNFIYWKKGNYPINVLLTVNILWVISGKMQKITCLYLSWALRKFVLKFAISNHFLVKSGKSLYILYKWVNLAFFPFMCIKKSFYIHNLHIIRYNVCKWQVQKPNDKKVINICLGTVFFDPPCTFRYVVG